MLSLVIYFTYIYCSLGIPKTILRFNFSLEGLAELRKVIMVIVYYSEKIQIKISQ